MATTKLMTAEELFELEDDGCRHELINGVLTSMAPTGEPHGRNLLALSMHLAIFIKRNDIGYGYVGDPGFFIKLDPDTVLAPDFAFVRKERTAAIEDQPGFIRLAPDFVVEVLSPSERADHINTKVSSYLTAGVELIWLVDPLAQKITVYQADQPTRFLAAEDTIDGGAVLPGFEMRVGDLLS